MGVSNYYHLLAEDDISDDSRIHARCRLERAGIDVEDLLRNGDCE